MTGKKIEKRIRTPDFRKYYATDIKSGLRDNDIRIELMNEKMNADKNMVDLVDAMMILSPVAAKKLLMQLSEIVKVYEQENGKIRDKN